MAAYYILGIFLVLWGLGLAVIGLMRPDFPPSGSAGRALVGATVLITLATLVALLASTHVEHPREEAAAEAAEAKAEGEPPPAAGQPEAGGKTLRVSEKEFSIALEGGNKLAAGKYTFAVQNTGKLEHDLAVRGGKLKETKTPLIPGGQSKDLTVDLEPGKYTFFCSVPGHEQEGMKVEVEVTGGKSKPAEPSKPSKPAGGAESGTTKKVPVSENEFSIALAGGNTLEAGRYKFDVKNEGKIQHDLAVEGGGMKERKTPLIAGGKSGSLNVTLKPGEYKFYCTVPGHEQAGMAVDVAVR